MICAPDMKNQHLVPEYDVKKGYVSRHCYGGVEQKGWRDPVAILREILGIVRVKENYIWVIEVSYQYALLGWKRGQKNWIERHDQNIQDM